MYSINGQALCCTRQLPFRPILAPQSHAITSICDPSLPVCFNYSHAVVCSSSLDSAVVHPLVGTELILDRVKGAVSQTFATGIAVGSFLEHVMSSRNIGV